MKELHLINAQIKSIHNIVNNRTYKVGDFLSIRGGSPSKILGFKLLKDGEAANVMLVTEMGEIKIEEL